MDLPETLPVMVLPDCSLFPGARLPLYIFEPRYRTMLEDALRGERMFCIGTIDGRNPTTDGSTPVYPHSTIGLIRACVGNDDGSSHLVLEGVKRVRFADWVEEKPYRVAKLEQIPSVVDDPLEISLICNQIKSLAGRMIKTVADASAGLEGKTIEELWQSLGSEEAIADFVAFHLVPDVAKRQPLLAMESVEERLAYLRECLRAAASPPAG